MPNKNSHAGHIPCRTCVICRQKKPKNELIRFQKLFSGIVFDLKNKLPGRGYYVCNSNKCILKMKKWIKRKL
ncbi:MAG: YlxR family protein [Candidatus Cloacimonadota bacterium]|nr:YlxR family protein [Candidatus Cloacimonadota bacterium]